MPGGRLAVRRDEALRERDDRRPRAQAARGQRGDHLVQAARGDAEEDEVELRQPGARGLDLQVGGQRARPGGRRGSRASARRRSACSSVRVCSVVRSPPRASSTATAVPKEPAPTTTARRAPGRAKEGRGRSATRGTTRPPGGVSCRVRREHRPGGVVAGDPADAAAAARARAAEPDVRQVGLDAPGPRASRRPRRTATAGRGGRCCRRAVASSSSSSTGVRASMHGTPSGVRSRQSSIGSASTAFSDASVAATAQVLGGVVVAREQPRGHVEGEQRQRLHAALAQPGSDDRRVRRASGSRSPAAERPGSRRPAAWAWAAANCARALVHVERARRTRPAARPRVAQARAGGPAPCSPSAARPPARDAPPGGPAGGRAPPAPRRRARGPRRSPCRRRSARGAVTAVGVERDDLGAGAQVGAGRARRRARARRRPRPSRRPGRPSRPVPSPITW